MREQANKRMDLFWWNGLGDNEKAELLGLHAGDVLPRRYVGDALSLALQTHCPAPKAGGRFYVAPPIDEFLDAKRQQQQRSHGGSG